MKPKIKPEIMWMAWHPDYNLCSFGCGFTKQQAKDNAEIRTGYKLSELRKQGFRIVKVKVSAVK